jgi:uncharacterized protein YlaN (UPF0358 family)
MYLTNANPSKMFGLVEGARAVAIKIQLVDESEFKQLMRGSGLDPRVNIANK